MSMRKHVDEYAMFVSILRAAFYSTEVCEHLGVLFVFFCFLLLFFALAPLGAFVGPLGALLGASWGALGAFLGPLGESLVGSGGVLGAVLEGFEVKLT